MHAPITSDVSHLAIICPTWVGDCVMATPALRAARQALPGARITLLGQPGLEALMTPSPWCDAFVGVDAKGWAGPIRTARMLRGLRADAALVLPNSFRSALVPWLARVPLRAGVRSDGRGGLLTHVVTLPESDGIRSTLEHYILVAADALGVDASALDRTMELGISPEQQAEAERLLQYVNHPFILLNPGGVRENKRWPAERFGQLADQLTLRFNMGVGVTGAPGERDVTRAVVSHARTDVVDLTNYGITLGSLKGVIKRAAIMVTNDTGPRHMAIALGTPVVSLFGPTDTRHTTIPNAIERILVAEPFLPEELVADDYEKACRIDRISVGDVAAACGALLGAHSEPAP